MALFWIPAVFWTVRGKGIATSYASAECYSCSTNDIQIHAWRRFGVSLCTWYHTIRVSVLWIEGPRHSKLRRAVIRYCTEGTESIRFRTAGRTAYLVELSDISLSKQGYGSIQDMWYDCEYEAATYLGKNSLGVRIKRFFFNKATDIIFESMESGVTQIQFNRHTQV